MNKIQQKELEILKQVDLCCKELGIKYFLDGGTLLGAVRHHGFIPWDDDIDIGMNRENYDRFIREAPSMLEKSNMFLQEYSTEKTTPFSFAKVRLNGTEFVDHGNRNVKMHRGIYIDIFPFDYAALSPEERARQFKKIDFWERLFICHQTPDIFVKPDSLYWWMRFIRRRIIHYVVQVVPISVIYKKINTLLRANAAGEISGHLSDKRSLLLSRDINEDIIQLSFEGYKFPAPKSYDDYLTKLYGNYMEFPPENERGGHNPYVVSTGE